MTDSVGRGARAESLGLVSTGRAVAVHAAAAFLLLHAWGCAPAGDKRAAAPAGAADGCGDAACAQTEPPAAPAQVAESEGADHSGHAHASAAEGDGHAADERGDGASADPTPAAIEARSCGHAARILDCDECRYEVGVVKLPRDVAAALVKTASVDEADIVRTLRLTGEVAVDSTAVVEVLTAAPGRIATVTARLGQQVEAGHVLAVIRSNVFGEAKVAYLESLTTAEVAAQERDRQQAVSSALAKLLESPAASKATAAMSGGPLGEWKGKLVGAAAKLEQAGTVLERERALVDKEASSRAELEAARCDLQTAEADYAALAEEAQMGLKLERLRAEGAAKQAEARLAAAEQHLHLFGLDDAAIRRLAVENENGAFAELEVRAPRAGTVTALDMTEGRFVDTTHALCTIADLTNLWVWCDLYERDLAALDTFMREQGKPAAKVRVSAFPDAFAGVVDFVGHEVSNATRTLQVRVQVEAHAGRLRPGMFATVDVALPTGRRTAMVPREAIMADEGRAFVFQRWQGDLWLRRHVVLGEVDGEKVEVVSGLERGVDVAVAGGFMLKSDVLREKMGAGCAD